MSIKSKESLAVGDVYPDQAKDGCKYISIMIGGKMYYIPDKYILSFMLDMGSKTMQFKMIGKGKIFSDDNTKYDTFKYEYIGNGKRRFEDAVRFIKKTFLIRKMAKKYTGKEDRNDMVKIIGNDGSMVCCRASCIMDDKYSGGKYVYCGINVIYT